MSVPRIRLETVEAIARKILMEYDSSLLSGEPRPIPIEASSVPGLYRDSIILLEQLRTLDKSRLMDKVGSLGKAQMLKIDHALEVSVGLLSSYNTV